MGDAHGHAALDRGAARPGAPRWPWPSSLTWLLKLDVVLFGGIRTGPFFGLLRPAARGGVRILYVASDQVVPGRTGGSVHVLEVARGLAARGHEVHAVVHGRGRRAPRRGRDGVRWHRVALEAAAPVLPLPARGQPWRPWRARRAAAGGDGALLQLRRRGRSWPRRARGVPSLLEVNSPVVDHPGSLEGLARRAWRWCGRCAAGASGCAGEATALVTPAARDRARSSRAPRPRP